MSAEGQSAAPTNLPAVHEDHELFDLANEEEILAELQGRVTEKFVYELKGVRDEHGNPVNGLSYSGTNWACREYAKQGEVIRILRDSIKCEVDPIDPDYVFISVMAQRFAVHPENGREIALDTAPGAKRQWRKMKKNKWENGQKIGEEIVEDPFFYEKGVSKACRNSKQALIPTDIVKRLIADALKLKQSGPARVAAATARRPAPARAAAPQQAAATTQAPATATPPAASGAAPASGAAQTAPPPAGAAPSKPAAPASGTPTQGAKQSKDSLVQKFEIVLKGAFKTQDGNVARAGLKKIAGTDKIGDLPEEDLKKYGKILQAIPKAYQISEDGSHIMDAKTGEVVWGNRPEAPPTEEAPPTAEGEPEQPLF